MLKVVSKPANGKPFYIVERLPKVSLDISQQSRAMGLRTATINAEVQIICRKLN